MKNERREGGVRERERVWVKEGNLISVLVKPNLFWKATETARCRYADLHGWREEKCPILRYGDFFWDVQ